MGIKELTLPSELTYIGPWGIAGCPELKKITCGDKLQMVDYHAFDYLSSLTEINLPNSLVIISKNAFEGCSKLTEINLGTSLETIDEGAFINCSGLKSLHFHDALTFIGAEAFKGCRAITAVTSDAAVPPVIDNDNAFVATVYNKAQLAVPAGSLDAYKEAESWKKFVNITAQSSAIGEIGADIDDSDAAPVYYNMNGIRVDNAAPGLYIVKRGTKVTKEYVTRQ